MSNQSAEKDALRETLIDFAEWRGDSPEDAEWAAETYLREVASSPLSPATHRQIEHRTPPSQAADR